MLPHIDPDVSTANPKFDALYRDLCMNKLNQDATTKLDAKQQKERDAAAEELRKARIANTKRNLIKSYLHAVAYRGDELPDDLQELVAIIAAATSAQLSKEDATLLRDDVERFKENITLISLVVSKAAAEDMTSLAQIFSHTDTASWTELPGRIESLKASTADAQEGLAVLRLNVAHEARDLHALYRQALETSIRILEQTIHGSVARHTKAKADYLATVAEGMARKLQVQQSSLLAQTRSSALQDALKEKMEHLERENLALKRKLRDAEEKMEDYRSAKVIGGIAGDYAEVLREIAKVQRDIDRLKQRS